MLAEPTGKKMGLNEGTIGDISNSELRHRWSIYIYSSVIYHFSRCCSVDVLWTDQVGYDLIWLVVWLPFFSFPIYWVSNHPNWLTHIFRRGGPTTNQIFFHGANRQQPPSTSPGPKVCGSVASADLSGGGLLLAAFKIPSDGCWALRTTAGHNWMARAGPL